MSECISVIVPIYNAGPYLDKCIHSIVEQSYRNLEILLIDDGSTDKSAEVSKQWETADNRVRYVYQKNSGVSAARNLGIELSGGEYIAFVDADDWMETNYLEKLHNSLNGCDLAVGSFCEEYESDRSESVRVYKKFTGNRTISDQVALMKDCLEAQIYTYTIWGKLFRRSLIGETRFAPLAYSEDAIFCREILAKCNAVGFIDEKGYHYRIGTAGVTADMSRVEEKALGAVKLAVVTDELCKKLDCTALVQQQREAMGKKLLAYMKTAVKNKVANPADSLQTVQYVLHRMYPQNRKMPLKTTGIYLLYIVKVGFLKSIKKDEKSK